jgi:hypothetical protein
MVCTFVHEARFQVSDLGRGHSSEARSQRKGCGAGKHLDPAALRSRGERSLEELELLRAQLTVTRRQYGGAPVEGASTPASVHLRLGTVTQGRRFTALETGLAPG